MKQLNFRSFFDAGPLLEDVQAAKVYLVKKYAEEKKIEPAKIKEVERKKILENPMFLEIKSMLERKKSAGYTLPFVKFAFDQGASIQSLTDLIDELLKRKNILNRLSKTVAEYSNMVKASPSEKPGYELLFDELQTLDAGVAFKKLHNMLSKNFRDTILSKASPAQLTAIESIASAIDALPPKKKSDGTSYTYWEDFGRKTGKYENNSRDKSGNLINAYPMYNNKEFALKEFIENIKDDIENWGSSLEEVAEKMRAMTTQCNIMYFKKGFLVISTRTFEAQKEFTKALEWCIGKYESYWESYVDKEDNVQINIINGNLSSDKMQPFYLIGYTVRENRNIRNSFDRNNQSMQGAVGSDLIEYFRNKFKDVVQRVPDTGTEVRAFGSYPSDLIDTVEAGFKQEASIKAALKRYFGKGKGLNPLEIVKSLITFTKGFLAGSVSDREWTEISGIVADIIAQHEHIGKNEFVRVFTNAGISTEAMWNVFDKVVGPGVLDADEIEEIRKTTLETISDAEEMHGFLSGRAQPKEKDLEHIKSFAAVIKDKEYTIGRLAEL
jgi:hypothetical protein